MSVTFESKELPSFMVGRLGVVEKSPAHQIHEVEVAVAAFRLTDGTSYVVFVAERYGVKVDVWHGVGDVFGMFKKHLMMPASTILARGFSFNLIGKMSDGKSVARWDSDGHGVALWHQDVVVSAEQA